MLSKKIRAHKEANPQASAKEIAAAVGTSPAYVYQVLTPKKKEKKVKPVEKDAQPSVGQQTLRKEIKHLNEAIDKWRNLSSFQEGRIDVLTKQVRELKEHHSGLEYVISYLEARLGEKNGASV